jgi:MarR family transcriptional regulator, transcriptional regulator for hemolysin
MNLGKMTPDKIFSLLMWDTGRLLRKAVDARAGEVGLTSAQWHLMSTLARCEKLNQALPNQANLAELLEIEPITLSRQIDRLTAAGMIERLPHPTDRRAHLLRLTEKAWPVVIKFKDIATEVLRDAMSGVQPAETDRMIVLLERIRANLTGKAEGSRDDTAQAKSDTKESISA